MSAPLIHVLGMRLGPLESLSRAWPLVASSRSAAYRMRDRGILPMYDNKLKVVETCRVLGYPFEVAEDGERG